MVSLAVGTESENDSVQLLDDFDWTAAWLLRNYRHWERNWSGRVFGPHHEQIVMKQKLFPHVH
jgi:hypothetical protein